MPLSSFVLLKELNFPQNQRKNVKIPKICLNIGCGTYVCRVYHARRKGTGTVQSYTLRRADINWRRNWQFDSLYSLIVPPSPAGHHENMITVEEVEQDVYGCTPLNSEEFMRRAVYHKVYVLKFFCKTKIWGPFIWGIV